MNQLAKLNGFTLGINGVYQVGTDQRTFDYSDGESAEKQLFQILSTCDDLSSDSNELESHIVDWPTEYHLSSARSNLLRPLNFDGVTRVLELGCGCGSITRFLGEQKGVQVDAIEGSPIRAGLASMRCHDLPNVSISTANFNDVEFPENHYDLVLFIGVTEYAGRFSDRETDQEALADLLNLGKRAANSEGITIVAIENRLGLKYMLGANEDHYAQRYVGLADYPNSTGIRTYSRDEWLKCTSMFKKTHFAYPFPDYKVPNVIVNETALSADSVSIAGHLKQSCSRDYLSAFDLGDNEHEIWNGLLQANSFTNHANSFLLFLSDSTDAIARLCDFKVAKYTPLELAYLDVTSTSLSVEQHDQKRHEVEEHLNAQITELQSHSANLQAKVDLISGSFGWRFLDSIRRLFGKNTI